MRKYILNLLLIFTTCSGITLSGSERCDSGFYVGGFGGINFVENPLNSYFKPEPILGGSIGYQFQLPIRLEVEFAYRNNDIKHIDRYFPEEFGVRRDTLHTLSVMANGYYVFDTACFGWRPYLGVGLGWFETREKLKVSNRDVRIVSPSVSGFAYQGIFGIERHLCQNIDLDIEYRYLRTHDHFKINNHSILLGLKYHF